jgi:hypothetical protein
MAKYVYAIHKLHPLITHLELVQTNPPYTIMKFKTYEQNVTRKKKNLCTNLNNLTKHQMSNTIVSYFILEINPRKNSSLY